MWGISNFLKKRKNDKCKNDKCTNLQQGQGDGKGHAWNWLNN